MPPGDDMGSHDRSQVRPSDALLSELEAIYQDLHAHPELSMQEHRTAGIAARWLRELGFEVTEGVGGTGVVGLLQSGEGPTVLLRADMDALPLEETTGLPYASRRTGVDRFGRTVPIAHACGHDLHVTWLMGAARVLAERRDGWAGTVMAVFQPGEETAQGARAMIADRMIERFPKPVVALAQHVVPRPAGHIGYRAGTMLSAGDSWEITMFGRGGHGATPQRTVDPVVMAAATVMRLQTVVSREVGTNDRAVVTVGMLHAGTSENVIPDRAVLRVNIRTFSGAVRERVLGAVRRIVEAEAAASGSPRPPRFEVLSEYPLTRNDATAVATVAAAFERHFEGESVQEIPPSSASEDFGIFGSSWQIPSVFWNVGGADLEAYRAALEAGRLDELPANHAPDYAPVLHPTLRVGVEAMVVAARAWLRANES